MIPLERLCPDNLPDFLVWGKVKLPKGWSWKEANAYRSKEYDFPRIDMLEIDGDLVVRFTPSMWVRKLGQGVIFLTIKDFKRLSANDVLSAFYESFDFYQAYPLGIHFEDGILNEWHTRGLRLGFTVPILKDVD